MSTNESKSRTDALLFDRPMTPIVARDVSGAMSSVTQGIPCLAVNARLSRAPETAGKSIGTDCAKSDGIPAVQRVPFVTVVIPVRNEAAFIERCIESIQRSDYPAELIEIVIVDGMSDDGTRMLIDQRALADARIRRIDNPEQIVPHAMNQAISVARGDVIIRVDGHAEVASDFVRCSVQTLQDHPECWCVGGVIESINGTIVGQTIAAAMSTPVGVGNARFRLGNYEGYTDTVAFGAYRCHTFDSVGGFDEELVRNQDDELNARLIQHGGRIWLTPAIRSRYYPRTSLTKLWKQYFQYGFWRIRTIQKLGRPATVRQLVPLLFVTGLITLTGAAAAHPAMVSPLLAYIGLYLTGIAAGSAMVARRVGIAGLFIAPVVFATLHFAYGFGCLGGVAWFVLLRRAGTRHSMSR